MIPISKAPYTALIQIKINKTHAFICGGSIVSVNAILTAAHCTFGFNSTQLTVRVGTSTYVGGNVSDVIEIVMHEKFDPIDMIYDISMLRLKTAIKLVKNLTEIVQLPRQGENINVGTILQVMGYGETQNSNDTATALRSVSLPVINSTMCKKVYPELYDGNVCTGYFFSGGKDACQGKFFVMLKAD